MANAFHLSTQETEKANVLWIQGQHGLPREFKDSKGYIVKPAETQQKESKNYNKIQNYKRQPFHLVESSKISAENNLIKMSCGLWL